MSGYRILIVDDEPAQLAAMRDVVAALGHTVDTATTAEEAVRLFTQSSYHVLITDLVLPGESGLQLVERVHESAPGTASVVVTGHASLRTAVSALKAGASDYLTKPIDPRVLKGLVEKLLSRRPMYIPNRLLAQPSDGVTEFDGMVARSRAMKDVFERIAVASASDMPVLISGESGTGKELCAASLHRRSGRREAPFIPVHAGALPQDLLEGELFGLARAGQPPREGRVDLARGGTLFLDEVHAMDARAQAALLEALDTLTFTPVGGTEEKKADVRVVAATGRDLSALVAAGQFREDLYYRLNALPIVLPPLRERPEDIAPLATRFAALAAARLKKAVPVLTEDAVSLLGRFAWPGNVRELRNVVEQAVLLAQGGEITKDHLPRLTNAEGEGATKVVRIPVGTCMKDVEREMIARTLDANNWNKNRAARILGISRRSLYNKIERYHIVAPNKHDPLPPMVAR